MLSTQTVTQVFAVVFFRVDHEADGEIYVR